MGGFNSLFLETLRSVTRFSPPPTWLPRIPGWLSVRRMKQLPAFFALPTTQTLPLVFIESELPNPMHVWFVIAFSAWLSFLCLLAFSLGAVAKAFPEAAFRRCSPYRPFPRWKRMLDLFCIGCFLPLILPVCALITLAIKLCSRGPVLFSQERIGFFGQPFQCLKFRTMMVNADTRSHEAHLEKLIRSPLPMTK